MLARKLNSAIISPHGSTARSTLALRVLTPTLAAGTHPCHPHRAAGDGFIRTNNSLVTILRFCPFYYPSSARGFGLKPRAEGG